MKLFALRLVIGLGTAVVFGAIFDPAARSPARQGAEPPNDDAEKALRLGPGYHPGAGANAAFSTAGARPTPRRHAGGLAVAGDVYFLYRATTLRSVASTAPRLAPAAVPTSRPTSGPSAPEAANPPPVGGDERVLVYDAGELAHLDARPLVAVAGGGADVGARAVWESRPGRDYLVRVAAAPGRTGAFRLAVGPAGEAAPYGLGCSTDRKRTPVLSADPPRAGVEGYLTVRGFSPKRKGAVFSARGGGSPIDPGRLKPSLGPCRVHLDADTLLTLVEFTTDADGAARIPYTPPVLDALLGVERDLQAAVNIDGRLELSNGVAARIGL